MATAKRNNKLIIGLAIVLVALGAFAIYKGKDRNKGERIFTEKVQKRTITETVGASGKVFPETEVKISSDVSGEIIELLVQEGDSVVKGQLLARINPDTYESQVERGTASVNATKAQWSNAKSAIENARAQKEQIEAQLSNARAVLGRNEKLHKEGILSDADYEASQTSVRQLEANLRAIQATMRSSEESAKAAEFNIKSTEASLKELRTSLRKTSLYAPTGGIISKLNVKKGERVVGTIQMAGTELMRIADLHTMEVQVEVSENDIPRVALNNDVDIEIDAYLDRKFKGKVTKIASTAANVTDAIAGAAISLTSDKVTNFIVKIRIDPASYTDLVSNGRKYPFRPGMSASVDINTKTVADVLSVPIQAVTTRDKDLEKKPEQDQQNNNQKKPDEKKQTSKNEKVKEIVFVCKGDTVEVREVKTGIQDDNFIQIASGLEDGEEVVSGPYATVSRKLKSGMKIMRDNNAKKDQKK